MYKNKGMLLESIINNTIKHYWNKKVAFIEKKSLNIQFNKVRKNDYGFLNIDNGVISSKSTVDYTGCYQGKFIAFEAKSTNEIKLNSGNIKIHQLDYLKKIHDNGGYSFFIIYFSLYDEFFLVYIEDYLNRNKKSLYYEEAKIIGKKIDLEYPGYLDFLIFLDKNIKTRN